MEMDDEIELLRIRYRKPEGRGGGGISRRFGSVVDFLVNSQG